MLYFKGLQTYETQVRNRRGSLWSVNELIPPPRLSWMGWCSRYCEFLHRSPTVHLTGDGEPYSPLMSGSPVQLVLQTFCWSAIRVAVGQEVGGADH